MNTHPRKLVYVAGRFSAPDRAGVERNIRAAVDVSVDVARAGAMPVTPHANTADPRFESVQPYQFWIAGTLEMLTRCDAIIMVPGWEGSTGAKWEHNWAEVNGMPVFYDADQLRDYLRMLESDSGGKSR